MKAPRRPQSHHVLPDGALRCVWMSAGLVSWRLCDREFDCEGCLFDQAMRGRAKDAPSPSTTPTVRRSTWTFPDDRRYALFHTWAQVQPDKRVRVGADALTAELLHEPTAVSLPGPGAWVGRGDAAITVQVTGGDIELCLPVSGRVVEVNTALDGRPAGFTEAPYGDGWLLEIEPTAGIVTDDLDALLSGPEMRRKALLDVQRYQRRVAMELLVSASDVGPTLADGGEPVLDLRLLLGAERHVSFIQELLR